MSSVTIPQSGVKRIRVADLKPIPDHFRHQRSPREIRRLLISWWQELAEDIDLLEKAIINAPEGAFTKGERVEATHALGSIVWDALTNDRPKHYTMSRARRLAWRKRAQRIVEAA